MKNILKFKDLAIAFANNQKVTYYDDERELNQICRIFALTEDTISIVNEEYQYDDLSFDKIILPIKEDHKQKATLEEAAERYDSQYINRLRPAFIAGAKWQQEQDKKFYSEEEVEEIFKQAQLCAVKADGVYFKYETFEKVKNK